MGDVGSDGVSERQWFDTRGNTPTIVESSERKKVWIELTVLWLSVLLVIRGLVAAYNVFGVHELILGLVPLLFIYAPVWLCQFRTVDSYSYRLYVPGFTDWSSWWEATKLSIWLNLSIWTWFIPVYVLYYTRGLEIIWGVANRSFIGTIPNELLLTILYQVFYVALPEEFFYRGYFQTRLNELFHRRWTVFGAKIGMGAVVANLFFAFGHSIVEFQWWHFATFFPGMIFAWSREKSNGVLTGALFHACCNVGIIILDTSFGLRSPL